MEQDKKYFVFISYSNLDNEWAVWLRHELEHYHLPASFNGRTDVRDSLREVFRDRDELSAGPEWDQQVHMALENTNNLIVICSPHSAKSEAVNKEVEAFIAMGKGDYIFPFIVEGDSPDEYFPKSLDHNKVGGDVNKDGGRDAAFVKVVSGVLRVNFSDLWNRYEIEKAEEERLQREQRDNLMRLQSQFVAERANRLIDGGDSLFARKLISEVMPLNMANPDRPCPIEAEACMRRAFEHSNAVLRGHTSTIEYVAFLPDQKRIVSASRDQSIRIWDASTGKCLQKQNSMLNWFSLFAVSPDGSMFATTSKGATISLWDADTILCLKTFGGISASINHIEFSPDGKQLVTASDDGTFSVWDLRKTDIRRTVKAHREAVHSASFSPDGKLIVTTSIEKKVKIWDVSTGASIKTIKHPTGDVTSALFDSEGKRLLTISRKENAIRIWDIENVECTQTLEGHSDTITAAMFTPDAKHIISCSTDKTVRLWEIYSEINLHTFEGHSEPVYCLACNDSAECIVSGSSDCTIRVWDNSGYPRQHALVNHSDTLFDMAYSPDGQRLVTASHDNTICVWNTSTGQCLHKLEGHTFWVTKACFSPDGSCIASASADKTVRLWDANTGQCLNILKGNNHIIRQLSFSPDGQTIVSSSENGNILLWNYHTGKCLHIINESCCDISSVVFSPDNRMIAFCLEYKNGVYIYEVASGKRLKRLQGHRQFVDSVAFTPDGNSLLSYSYDGTARLWSLPNGKCIQIIEGLSKHGSPIAIIPDGSKVALCLEQNDVIIQPLGLSDSRELKPPIILDTKSEGIVHSLQFSPDGKYLLSLQDEYSGCYHGSQICVWDADSGIKLQTTVFYGTCVNAVFRPDGRQIAACNSWWWEGVMLFTFPTLQDLIDETRERFKDRPLTLEERKRYYLE